MDFIADLLEPYKENIGKLTGILTIGHMLSAVFLLNDIRKAKTTAGQSIIPYSGGLILTALSLKFGAILRDDATIQINFIGVALNVIYILFFYWYTPDKDKTRVWGLIGLTGALAAAGIGYAQYEDPKLVEFRFGMVITVFVFILVGSPFLSLGEIIRNKSTAGLPFPLIVSGTIISFMWMLYGLCLNNGTIVFQNAVLLTMSAIQLSLFAIYPSTPSPSKNQAAKKAKKSKKSD